MVVLIAGADSGRFIRDARNVVVLTLVYHDQRASEETMDCEGRMEKWGRKQYERTDM